MVEEEAAGVSGHREHCVNVDATVTCEPDSTSQMGGWEIHPVQVYSPGKSEPDYGWQEAGGSATILRATLLATLRGTRNVERSPSARDDRR